MSFNSSCSTNVAARGWDLDNDGSYDDGTSSTVTKVFATPGAYTIKLGVANSHGAFDIESKTVTVANRGPTAGFSFAPATPTSGQSVTFTSSATDPDGTISKVEWDWDNNGTYDDTGAAITHTFSTPGTYTVKQRVTDNSNATATTTRTVIVANRLPTAAFSVLPLAPNSGDPVTFSSGATDPDGTISKVEWDWDGNGTYDSTGTSVNHTFATPGTYTVGQRVTDNSGGTNTTTKSVAVANRRPNASFSFSPASPQTGQNITFTSSATDQDGTIAKVEWDWDGNGTYDATGASATHAYGGPGTYTVTQRVTDDRGLTDTASKNVTVGNRGPTAGFTVNPASPTSGQTVTVTSTANDPDGTIAPTSIEWDLDDNGVYEKTGTTASTAFANPGNHTIKQRVTDNSGATATTSKVVAVSNRGPSASFSLSPADPVVGQAVTFDSSASNDPDGFVASTLWDLDNDGQWDDGSGKTATKTFNTIGNYTVRLRIQDNSGAVAIVTKTFAVADRPPVAAFTISPASPKVGDEVTFTSASTDEGKITALGWDLNDDGVFDDGNNETVTHTFDTAGTYPIALKVTDDNGVSSIATQTVDVAGLTPSAPSDNGGGTFDTSIPTNPTDNTPTNPVESPGGQLRTLDPFPIVRIRGRTTTIGARISLLAVKGPTGAKVTIRCYGKGCPKKPLTAKLKAKKGKSTATVSFTKLRRSWRAGTVFRVLVSKSGLIGKYTQFTIRKRKAPVRVDSCLMPGSNRPAKCPVAK